MMLQRVLLVIVVVALLSAALLGVGFWLGRATSPMAANVGWIRSMMNGGWTPGFGGMMGGGMMGGVGSWQGGTGSPLTVEEAEQAVDAYLRGTGNDNLVIDEIMIFDNNAYALIKDTQTDSGAFELLVDNETRAVFLEYGPSMMWNTEYGMMGGGSYGMMRSGGMMGGGMMGSFGGGSASPLAPGSPVTAEQVMEIAQSYLDQYLPGVVTADMAAALPGYYTIDTAENGRILGMLSINASTGQVWVHTWHGRFIEEAEIGG
jgi:hypothetical protein